MEEKRGVKIEDLLEYINPSKLTYAEWVEVGMAIKEEGLPCEAWDEWSQKDDRYKPDDCFKRWDGFNGGGITGATITHLAKQGGWMPAPKLPKSSTERVISFDEDLIVSDLKTIDVTVPLLQEPYLQAIEYLKHAFKTGELINVVTAAKWDDERQKWFPANAGFSQERDAVIKRLEDGLDNFAGDRNKSAGVWIRTNPMDGTGIKNSNVSSFRHVLVESDDMDLEKQIEIYKRLNLPITCLTLSAGKSVHALVKVDAKDANEYKERVSKVFDACKDQGLTIDTQNRNPSRLTRFAGFERGDKEQSLLAVEIGAKSYEEWIKDLVIDDLPEWESLDDFFDDPPELPPETIKGVLRRGEKLVLTGPSKAGKSFALIQLGVALATGAWWLGRFKCEEQRVVYINLELTRENAAYRLLDVWKAMRNEDRSGLKNLAIWNLRGASVTTKVMVDTIIKRHKSMANPPGFYIVDPIYKINAGDENAAKDINDLLREFDRLCSETDANLVYAHHHSKGSQFGKRALDRGSGSGVIGRDADAAIDLDFVEVPEDLKRQRAEYFKDSSWNDATALRVETTFRNFRSKKPFNIWFKYPVHKSDTSDEFQRLKGNAEKLPLEKAEDGKASKKIETDGTIKSVTESLFEAADMVQIRDIEEQTNLSRNRIKRFIDESDEYRRDNSGKVYKVSLTEKSESDSLKD